jgi:integrase
MTRQLSMVALAEEYLAARRKIGFVMKIEGQQLLAFARYADGIGHRGAVTTELSLRWARLPAKASPLYWSRRLAIVRRFAKSRFLFDAATEVPPEGLLGPASRRSPPYIYSEEEIADLLRTCARLSPVGGLRPWTYATLFGLLASTGLRISEALRLRKSDVDLEAGVLSVIETKFHKSRLVPLHASTTQALRTYAEHRDRRHPLTLTQAFFVTEKGTSLKYGRMFTTFNALRHMLGWSKQRAPRIHDLRHTFAVRRLLSWYQDGGDVDQKIASLSTYLGHTKVSDTYWYLTAVPELMAVASTRWERMFDRKEQP